MMSLYSWVTISKPSLDLDPDPCLLSSLSLPMIWSSARVGD